MKWEQLLHIFESTIVEFQTLGMDVWGVIGDYKELIGLIGLFVYSTPKIYRDFRHKGLAKIPFAQRIIEPILQWIDRKMGFWKADSYPSYIPQSEHEFYEIFAKRLQTAKMEIYNSGDGFSMETGQERGTKFATSSEKADFLDAAMIRALKNNKNLIVHRFQISSACNISWLSRLIAMKEAEFGDRYRIYVDDTYDHIGCFCAIDPDRERCVYEWQLITGRKRMKGTESKGFGFTYKNKEICKKVKELFVGYYKIDPAGEIEEDKDGKPIKALGICNKDGLSIAELRKLQVEFWDMRVRAKLLDDSFLLHDPELIGAFQKLRNQKKGRKLKISDAKYLPFPKDEKERRKIFPPTPLPSQSVSEIIEKHRVIAKSNGDKLSWLYS